MSSKFAVTVAALLTLGVLILSSQVAEAQVTLTHRSNWEFRVPGGAILPSGAQRAAIKRGNLTAAQLVYAAHPVLAVTATAGWARSRDVAAVGEPRLDVFTYDVGTEFRAPRWNAGRTISFSPFVGMGVGARSYDYRGPGADATHNLAAFGSAGGELGIGRGRLRLEARDYVSGFKPLDGNGASDTRSDVVVMAALRLANR